MAGSRSVDLRRLRAVLAGSSGVPETFWRAAGPWAPKPSTAVALVVGLILFGVGETLLVVAALGATPWVVLAQGVSIQTGMSLGQATFLISALVLALWLPLRERPGLGTLANALIIALTIDIALALLPLPRGVGMQVLAVFAGVLLVGLGSGLYLTAGLGAGPRDGWMTGLHRRTGIPVARVRLSMEVAVLVLGLVLGGTAGWGTAIFALGIGRSVAWGLAGASRASRWWLSRSG